MTDNTTKPSAPPFSIKLDAKGNPQIYGYGGLAMQASFYPGGFPSDAEMHATAELIVLAVNSHAKLVEALERAHTALCSVPTFDEDKELNTLLNEADDVVMAALKLAGGDA